MTTSMGHNLHNCRFKFVVFGPDPKFRNKTLIKTEYGMFISLVLVLVFVYVSISALE